MQHLHRHGMIGYTQFVLFLFCLVLCWDCIGSVLPAKNDEDHPGHREDDSLGVSYGTEVSWPMQHAFATIDSHSLSAQQRQNYIAFMDGCALAYGRDVCETSERHRLTFNAQQPLWQRNFTAVGFAKVMAPNHLFQALEDFWYDHYDSDENDNDNDERHNPLLVDELWPPGNMDTNHWEAPTKLLLVDPPDPKRPKLNVRLRRQLFQQVQTMLQDWMGGGVPLVATAMYGIRAYTRGSIVVPHVERHPLVLSAVIHVAQEGLEQDWPLELVNHDGIAVHVTLKPGEMLLYESHSILHGRPYPLQGDVYADLFLHFEPIGFTAEAEQRRPQQAKTSAKDHFLLALQRSQQQNADTADLSVESSTKKKTPLTSTSQRFNRELPYYIKEGTVESDRWRQNFVFQRRDLESEHVDLERNRAARRREQRAVWTANRLAMEGELEQLRELAEKDPTAVNQRDQNGWKPIHEAARSGEVEVLKYLIDEHDVDINERTNGGHGGTPLFWAEHALHPNHEAIALLRRRGAVAIPPELAG